MRRAAFLLLLVLSLAACNGAPGPIPATAIDSPPAALEPPGRLIAIGDLHGDLARTRQSLRLAGLIDEHDRWIGGDAWVVQTGDLTDRGPDTRAVLDLWRSLERGAEAAGGRVIVLTSNHEAMCVGGIDRWASDGDIHAFLPASPAGTTLTAAEREAGLAARRHALGPGGVYGRWIAGHDAIVVVGDALFVHAGLSPEYAARGVDALNTEIRSLVAAGRYEGILDARDGPLWYRRYHHDPESEACPRLERALALVGARRMVVGHTVQHDHRIRTRCSGRLIAIDTGIAEVMGGAPSALELTAGDARALHPDGVLDLEDP